GWRCPFDHLCELPSEIHRILHTDVETLSAQRGMHVCGIASQQDASVAVGCGLPSHIVESGDPRGAVGPEVCPVNGGQRRTYIAQGWCTVGPRMSLGQHHPHPLSIT